MSSLFDDEMVGVSRDEYPYCLSFLHRIRLYAGEDRPFFEDIEASQPSLYLIHNLLTSSECEDMIKKAAPKLQPLTHPDPLSFTDNPSSYVYTKRATLWQGEIQSAGQKAISERLSQVTGFPTSHFSDFIVDQLDTGSHWKPRVDSFPPNQPIATVSVFLTDNTEAEWIYRRTAHNGDTIRIRPRRGMAIVHHVIEQQKNDYDALVVDPYSQYSLETVTGTHYIARKFVFAQPLSLGRRFVLPLFQGYGMTTVYTLLGEQFGAEQGSYMFDHLLLAVPIVILGLLAQAVLSYVQQQSNTGNTRKESNKLSTSSNHNKSKARKSGRKKKD